MFNRYGNNNGNSGNPPGGGPAINRTAFVGRPGFKQQPSNNLGNPGRRFGNQWASSAASKSLRRIPPPANVPSREAQQRKLSHLRSTTIDVTKWNLKENEKGLVKSGESFWGQARPSVLAGAAVAPTTAPSAKPIKDPSDIKLLSSSNDGVSIQQRLARAADSLSNWKIETGSTCDAAASGSAIPDPKASRYAESILKDRCTWLDNTQGLDNRQCVFANDELVEARERSEQENRAPSSLSEKKELSIADTGPADGHPQAPGASVQDRRDTISASTEAAPVQNAKPEEGHTDVSSRPCDPEPCMVGDVPSVRTGEAPSLLADTPGGMTSSQFYPQHYFTIPGGFQRPQQYSAYPNPPMAHVLPFDQACQPARFAQPAVPMGGEACHGLAQLHQLNERMARDPLRTAYLNGQFSRPCNAITPDVMHAVQTSIGPGSVGCAHHPGNSNRLHPHHFSVQSAQQQSTPLIPPASSQQSLWAQIMEIVRRLPVTNGPQQQLAGILNAAANSFAAAGSPSVSQQAAAAAIIQQLFLGHPGSGMQELPPPPSIDGEQSGYVQQQPNLGFPPSFGMSPARLNELRSAMSHGTLSPCLLSMMGCDAQQHRVHQTAPNDLQLQQHMVNNMQLSMVAQREQLKQRERQDLCRLKQDDLIPAQQLHTLLLQQQPLLMQPRHSGRPVQRRHRLGGNGSWPVQQDFQHRQGFHASALERMAVRMQAASSLDAIHKHQPQRAAIPDLVKPDTPRFILSRGSDDYPKPESLPYSFSPESTQLRPSRRQAEEVSHKEECSSEPVEESPCEAGEKGNEGPPSKTDDAQSCWSLPICDVQQDLDQRDTSSCGSEETIQAETGNGQPPNSSMEKSTKAPEIRTIVFMRSSYDERGTDSAQHYDRRRPAEYNEYAPSLRSGNGSRIDDYRHVQGPSFRRKPQTQSRYTRQYDDGMGQSRYRETRSSPKNNEYKASNGGQMSRHRVYSNRQGAYDVFEKHVYQPYAVMDEYYDDYSEDHETGPYVANQRYDYYVDGSHRQAHERRHKPNVRSSKYEHPLSRLDRYERQRPGRGNFHSEQDRPNVARHLDGRRKGDEYPSDLPDGTQRRPPARQRRAPNGNRRNPASNRGGQQARSGESKKPPVQAVRPIVTVDSANEEGSLTVDLEKRRTLDAGFRNADKTDDLVRSGHRAPRPRGNRAGSRTAGSKRGPRADVQASASQQQQQQKSDISGRKVAELA